MKAILRNRLLALASFIALTISAFANNDKPIEFSQLPNKAKQVINTYFAGKEVAASTLETGIMDKEYDVMFADGNKIEFDRKGQWTNIECLKSQVPEALVPKAIVSHVQTKYKGQRILKIEKDNREYDVKLSNGLEITFNKNFKVIEIDRD